MEGIPRKKRQELVDKIDSVFPERETAYKWLVPLVADAKLVLKEEARRANELVTSKRSQETMVRVETMLQEKKTLLEENIVLKYQLEYIKTLIPEVDDIVEYDECFDESMEDDNPGNFLTSMEYLKLSDTEKTSWHWSIIKKEKNETGKSEEILKDT